MSYTDWKDKTSDFKKIDVRGIQGNFFQGIKKRAINTEVGSGLEIVQSFDPIPLYDVMEGFLRRQSRRQKSCLQRSARAQGPDSQRCSDAAGNSDYGNDGSSARGKKRRLSCVPRADPADAGYAPLSTRQYIKRLNTPMCA